MRPEHAARRAIIREWMSQPRDKRQSREQTEAFARKAIEKHEGPLQRRSIPAHHGLAAATNRKTVAQQLKYFFTQT